MGLAAILGELARTGFLIYQAYSVGDDGELRTLINTLRTQSMDALSEIKRLEADGVITQAEAAQARQQLDDAVAQWDKLDEKKSS